MAGLGFKDFQVGEVLTSSDVDGYLMQQTVMRFADSGARGSALGTASGTGVALAEGMVSYLDDLNSVEVYDGSDWVNVAAPDGYVFSEKIVYTSSGTWVKANYPRLKAVRVTCVGAGGGGGGSSNTNNRGGGGGGAGAFAQSFIPAAALGTAVTVTVGAGGAGGTTTGDGGNGTDSSFGTAVVADAGSGGQVSGTALAAGGVGGTTAASTGDIKQKGQAGAPGTGTTAERGAGAGGDSVLGLGGESSVNDGSGEAGVWGGGGAGGFRWTISQAGSAGGNGLVIVEVFK